MSRRGGPKGGVCPRVTIGVPVFNAERYLAHALQSVQRQTLGDFEVVISDNGSTDSTLEVVQAFVDVDPRFRLISHTENRGAAWNHNEVLRHATAPYFKWLAYDDAMAPTFLERCVDALDDDRAVLAFARTSVIDAAGDLIRRYPPLPFPFHSDSPSERLSALIDTPLEQSLLHLCYPVYGVMRTGTLRQTPGIASYNASDNTLLAELALRGRFTEIPNYLIENRRHALSSVVVHRRPEDIARWFDTSKGVRFPMPTTRLTLGYADAVRRVPLSASERARCALVLLRWLRRDRHPQIIGGELKLRVRGLGQIHRM